MRRTTQSGRSKLDAALGAARGFVGRLNLAPAPGGDRVAIVGFNDTAWIELPMSAAAEEVAAAFDRLPPRMAEGTRLDLGFP